MYSPSPVEDQKQAWLEHLSGAVNEVQQRLQELTPEKSLINDLERAYDFWSMKSHTPGEIILSQNQFIEAILAWDNIDPSEDVAAFLVHTAAYYGKLMHKVIERASSNRQAIYALVVEVAVGTTIRVPWRASAMLEYMDIAIVKDECAAYSGMIRNTGLFPHAFLNGMTRTILADAISNRELDPSDASKLKYVLRQLDVDFESRANQNATMPIEKS